MKTLVVKTAQMARAKREPDMLDITVKSGDKVFAPSWEIVMAHKDGRMTDDQYKKEYLQRMRSSYAISFERWMQVLNSGSVTLACYCRAGEFCHRLLLAELLQRAGERAGIEVIYEGELV